VHDTFFNSLIRAYVAPTDRFSRRAIAGALKPDARSSSNCFSSLLVHLRPAGSGPTIAITSLKATIQTDRERLGNLLLTIQAHAFAYEQNGLPAVDRGKRSASRPLAFSLGRGDARGLHS
jgi:hypothetical protein